MSNQLTKEFNIGNGSSEKSYPNQSSWMSRWSQTPSKRGSLVAPHSKTFCIEDGLDHKQKRLRRSLNISSDIPKSSGVNNYSPFRLGLGSDALLVPNAAENSKRVVVFGRNFSDDNAGCSLRNVKTMRICATVDSLGNSDEDCPLFSRTTTHHFIFGKQNGMELSRDHQAVRESRGGVKIQPLWSSTDSEKDNFGDVVTTGADDSRDLSAEADTMDLVALSEKKHFSGVLLSPPAVKLQHTTKDKPTLTDTISPPENNHRAKSPAINIPNINSMDDDDMEPTSTSRTISMGAEHLISRSEQPLKSKPTPQNKECPLSELSSIWVKRWKLGTSDVGGSALPANRKSKSTIFQSSWIQRWSDPRRSEERSSKLPADVLERKRFPSIAAMALMGKSMNGFRTCKFLKRGPLVVWSSEDC